MLQRKKLQVFVSSTYVDLKIERQAAVEAILQAGHIPAGMELFSAGDESQMEVIRRWIDESDIYLLILGGRYGSIDYTSGKSYTHLEYDYALKKNKAMFSVVITDHYLDEKVKAEGKNILELEYPQKLKDFKRLVTSKLVKFWNNTNDIKFAILQTLSEFDKRTELAGWVQIGKNIVDNNSTLLIKQLTEENISLSDQIVRFKTARDSNFFDNLYTSVNEREINLTTIKEQYIKCFEQVAELLGDKYVSEFHIFWVWYCFNDENDHMSSSGNLLGDLARSFQKKGFLENVDAKYLKYNYYTTMVAKYFLKYLELERNTANARNVISEFKKQHIKIFNNSTFRPSIDWGKGLKLK